MTRTATIRGRLRQIVADLRNEPSISGTTLTHEYIKRHGIDGRTHDIAAMLLAEMFDPGVRIARRAGRGSAQRGLGALSAPSASSDAAGRQR